MRHIVVIILMFLLFSCTQKQEKENNFQLKNEIKPPAMGWASWNNYHVNISEDIIMSQADAMVELGLDKYGYRFINTDDGFYGGRDENGKIIPHPDRFPNGMKVLSEYIRSKGLIPGIYTDAGVNTCASHYDRDTIGVGMGLYGYDEQDIHQYLIEWDYDFIKVDWCGGQWLGLDEESRYTKIGKIIYDLKPHATYNVCRWEFPGNWVVNVADSWRISGDIRNNFNSVMRIVDINAELWRYAVPGAYNDMDMLQVGRGMSYEEDKTHFTMWCMMHSPLLLGNDLTKMSQETVEIVTNEDLIAINQSPFVYQARRLYKEGDKEIWAKPLISTASGEVAVVLLNRSRNEKSIELNLDKIGIDYSKGYSIKDLWSKEVVEGSLENIIIREVNPHGVVVLKIVGTSIPFNVFQR